MTRVAETPPHTGLHHCGCCGRQRPADRLAALEFTRRERSEQYFVLGSADAELHFALPGRAPTGQCLVLVSDALAIWKRLREHAIPGVGNVADREYGLRDFTFVDPDGNQVRVGSPIPHG